MGRRWIQARNGELVEVRKDYTLEEVTAAVHVDIPAYYSHATNQMIEGRVQRREDFKVSGCREWEGQESEEREAARHRAYAEQRRENAVEQRLQEVLPHMSADVRGALLHGDCSTEFNERSLRGRRT